LKGIAVFLFLLIVFMGICPGDQETSGAMQNVPGKTKGRIVKLKKLAIAQDARGAFIFKNPHHIIAIDDGSFFLVDDGRVLKFSSNGLFIKEVARTGEGPGEAPYLHEIYRRADELIANTGFSRKLMVFDLDGNLKTEYRENRQNIGKNPGLRIDESNFSIMGHRKDKSFVVLGHSAAHNPVPGITQNTRPEPVFLLSDKNEWLDKLLEIPVDCVNIKLKSGDYFLPKVPVIYASDGEFIYFCHTESYEIKKYHIESNRVISSWKREYRHVRVPDEIKDKLLSGSKLVVGSVTEKTREYAPPKREYLEDIKRLFVVESRIWVLTSTFDREKGLFIDVYNQGGDCIDGFYLQFPQGLYVYTLFPADFQVFKNHLFIKEIDPEENFQVAQYQFLDD